MKTFKALVLLLLLTLPPLAVFAQSGIPLETEIQNTEMAANRQGVSAPERHDALVRLAHLRRLSGDIEGAAKNWLEAAAAIPGQVDDEALLSCAYCLAAMGEWDRAITALEPLLIKSARARFLSAAINALNTGSVSALGEMASSSEYLQMRSEIYYLLWKISKGSEAERWRQSLVSEFPQSPEGRLAAGSNPQAIVLMLNPFWLFAGRLDSLPLVAVATPAPSQTGAATQASAAQTGNSAGVKLQTGIYSQEANAQSQAASLRSAGFAPFIESRVNNSTNMWAVIVFAGADTNRTIRELREAGFDSFPLR
jgi:tetratricopeptide (TPR) repeat protein